MSKGNLPDSATMSNLGRAVETGNEESIDKLDRAELVFYVCAVLGIDPPADHPSEYSGRVSRELLRSFADAIEGDGDGDE